MIDASTILPPVPVYRTGEFTLLQSTAKAWSTIGTREILLKVTKEEVKLLCVETFGGGCVSRGIPGTELKEQGRQSVEVMRRGGLQRDIICSCGGWGRGLAGVGVGVCVSDSQGGTSGSGMHYAEEHNIAEAGEPPSCQGQAPGP